MSNFTLETNRNTAIQNIPRLTFQAPQTTTGTTGASPSTNSPIFFCQIGCQLDFQFSNINSATLKNDGTYFTIIPADNSNNYINWNGSGASGQNMIRFDLKEIKFSAPARDVVNSITYNRSIQFYYTFVNTTYPNIMIVITIIGQANNVGNALTDGFILLRSLTNQIPLRNETKIVSNLRNVNIGKLLPSNKSFFSTLIATNSIQYISMTRIIDIPQVFLDNLISRIYGDTNAYETKVNEYTRQIPSNPPGTIIFYTENIKPINSDQSIVCNANCDQVVGDSSLLIPEFGTTTTQTRGGGTTSRRTRTIPTRPVPQEECEEEYVFPGRRTGVRINTDGTRTSADTSNEKNLTTGETTRAVVDGLFIGVSIVFIIVLTCLIFGFLIRAANLSSIWGLFSRELWANPKNIPWIIVAFIGFLAITSFLIAAMCKLNEESNKDNSEQNKKINSWELVIIGFSIWFVCALILLLKFILFEKLLDRYRNYNGINSSYSGNIQKFDNLTSRIISDYTSNPSNFATPGSSSRKNILEASKIYNNFTPDQKSFIDKSNPQLANLIGPNSKIIQGLLSNNSYTTQDKKQLDNFVTYLQKNPVLITPKILSIAEGIKPIYPKEKSLQELKVGQPVPKILQELTKSKIK
jgi:hypothetical protein